MDIATLHSVTEDLAGYISELTVSDLGRPTHADSVDVGDLYLSLLERNKQLSAGILGQGEDSMSPSGTPDREALILSANLTGGGFESEYRSSARKLESAFASVTDPEVVVSIPGVSGTHEVAELVETQIRDTVIHTWDVVQALGIDDYAPKPEVAERIVQYVRAHPEEADSRILEKLLESSDK